MTRSVQAGLLSHLGLEVQTLATCWKVELNDRDGTIMTFTDLDKNIIVGGLEYEAAVGFSPTAVRQSDDAPPDNVEVSGVISSDAITEDDLIAGRFDFAKVTVFLVNYEDPDVGSIVLVTGTLGEVSSDDTAFKATLRGLTERLNRKTRSIVTPTCEATLGDDRCKYEATAYIGTVTEIVSNRRIFKMDISFEPLEAQMNYKSYWLLDEQSGADHFDSATFVRDGVATGGVTPGSTDRNSGTNAVHFDGTANTHIRMDGNGYDCTDQWSLFLWAKADAAVVGTQTLFALTGPYNDHRKLAVRIVNDKLCVAVSNAGTTLDGGIDSYVAYTDVLTNLTGFHQYAFIFDRGEVKIYQDGVLIPIDSQTGHCFKIHTSTATSVYIGGEKTTETASLDETTYNFLGTIQEVIFADIKAYSANLIDTLHKGAIGVSLPISDGDFVHGFTEWETGLNRGVKMDVKAHNSVTGDVELYEPMWYNVAVNDVCVIHKGCDRTLDACKARDNVVNFRGFPFIRGLSALNKIV